MKYIKTYEKLKLHDKRRLSSYLSEFIPGYYIIFTFQIYDWKINKSVNQLIFGKILKIAEALTASSGEFKKFETYLDIKIIDMKNEYNIIKKNQEYYSVNVLKEHTIFFKSPSYSAALNEFEKLKEEEPYKSWIINNNMNKYNI